MSKIDSLDALESAFAAWRRSKRHPTEPVPAALMERARRAAGVHGDKDVARVTKIERSRLWKRRVGKTVRTPPRAKSRPAFSRLELSTPIPTDSRPLAEVETPEGVKLRVFAETPEVLSLLSSLLSVGGQR